MEQKIIFYVETDSVYFIKNRLELAFNMLNEGYDVHVATFLFSYCDKNIIESSGIKCHFGEKDGKQSIIDIYKEIKRISPFIIHIFTINAVAKLGFFLLGYKKSKIVFSITGLGYTFISKSLYARFIRIMLRLIIPLLNTKHDIKFIFHNEDDKNIFIKKYYLKEYQAHVIKGSGVNLDIYYPTETNNKVPVVLFLGRLLKDKGIYEYLEAAKIIYEKKIPLKFIIAGSIDKKNPSSLSDLELKQIIKLPYIEYKGYVKDVIALFQEIDIACLPSYREGLSKYLIEAGACGKPIITTDVPGCRDVVENNINGIIVPAKDSAALANAIIILCLDREKMKKMSESSRKIIKNNFSIDVVVEKTKLVYKDLNII